MYQVGRNKVNEGGNKMTEIDEIIAEKPMIRAAMKAIADEVTKPDSLLHKQWGDGCDNLAEMHKKDAEKLIEKKKAFWIFELFAGLDEKISDEIFWSRFRVAQLTGNAGCCIYYQSQLRYQRILSYVKNNDYAGAWSCDFTLAKKEIDFFKKRGLLDDSWMDLAMG